MSELATAAGRALLDELANRVGKPNDRLLREQILAIEAEAGTLDVEAASEGYIGMLALSQMLDSHRPDDPEGCSCGWRETGHGPDWPSHFHGQIRKRLASIPEGGYESP